MLLSNTKTYYLFLNFDYKQYLFYVIFFFESTECMTSTVGTYKPMTTDFSHINTYEK